MKITKEDPKKLKPHPKNPRRHPQKAIDKLKISITEYGFANPILVSADGYVLAGHARLKAALELKLDEVPVIHLPIKGDKAIGYMIADNRLQEETEWDIELVQQLLDEMVVEDVFTGFDEGELAAYMTKIIDADLETNETSRFGFSNSTIVSIGRWICVLEKGDIPELQDRLAGLPAKRQTELARRLVDVAKTSVNME